MTEIELGDTVKDIYTGFEGVAVARTEFINGCIQFNVAPKWNKKDNPLMEEAGVDENSLKVIKKKPVKRVKKVKPKEPEKEPPGGRTRIAKRMRGY